MKHFSYQKFSFLFLSAGLLVAVIFSLLTSCAQPVGTFAGNPNGTNTVSSNPYSGYILVANTTTKSVVMMDPDFNYVKTVFQAGLSTTDVPSSLAIYDSNTILIGVEGTDRVVRASLSTGAWENGYINDSNLNGTIKGIGRLSGGDILISDAVTAIERYTSGTVPARVGGTWPQTSLNTPQAIIPISTAANYFLVCHAGTGQTARIYNNSFATIASATALTPGTSLGSAHNAVGCAQAANGNIGVAWSGTADAVRIYNSGLTSVVGTFQSPTSLPTPVALGVRPNGNWLAVDNTNSIVELDATVSTSVATYSSPFIAAVTAILVMP